MAVPRPPDDPLYAWEYPDWQQDSYARERGCDPHRARSRNRLASGNARRAGDLDIDVEVLQEPIAVM
jgi:hypothetical protein